MPYILALHLYLKVACRLPCVWPRSMAAELINLNNKIPGIVLFSGKAINNFAWREPLKDAEKTIKSIIVPRAKSHMARVSLLPTSTMPRHLISRSLSTF